MIENLVKALRGANWISVSRLEMTVVISVASNLKQEATRYNFDP